MIGAAASLTMADAPSRAEVIHLHCTGDFPGGEKSITIDTTKKLFNNKELMITDDTYSTTTLPGPEKDAAIYTETIERRTGNYHSLFQRLLDGRRYRQDNLGNCKKTSLKPQF
jgi:hypothetical protein